MLTHHHLAGRCPVSVARRIGVRAGSFVPAVAAIVPIAPRRDCPTMVSGGGIDDPCTTGASIDGRRPPDRGPVGSWVPGPGSPHCSRRCHRLRRPGPPPPTSRSAGRTGKEAAKYRLARRDDDALFGYVVGPQSPKTHLHPAEVVVWAGRAAAAGFTMTAPEAPPRYAFLGVRPCELAAIAVQDRVFLGGERDAVYGSRRDGVFLVAVNCTNRAAPASALPWAPARGPRPGSTSC